MPTTTTAPPPQKAMIKVGIIFITEPIQLLDVAPIDILGMMEPSYLRALGLPETFCAKGIDFEYHYVNETGKGPNQMSAGFKLAVTVISPSFLLSPLTCDQKNKKSLITSGTLVGLEGILGFNTHLSSALYSSCRRGPAYSPAFRSYALLPPHPV